MILTRNNKKRYSTHGRIALQEYLNEEFLDEHGDAVIHVNISDSMILFDPMSFGKQRDLNPEILNYIDRKSNLIDASTPVKVVFHGRRLSSEEKHMVSECISEYYSVRSFNARVQLRRIKRKTIALACFGIVVLSAYFALAYAIGEGMKTEILSIIGSFALWEAADLFILERRDILHDLLIFTRQSVTTIEYADESI